jgi:hypothetical protein
MSKSKANPELESGRKDYGIDRRTFIVAWETSESPDEVFEKLTKKSKEMKQDPMPLPVILALASNYRRAGLNLRKFKPGRKVSDNDLAADKEMLEQLKANRPSEGLVDPAMVDAVLLEIVRRLSRP